VFSSQTHGILKLSNSLILKLLHWSQPNFAQR